MAVHGLDDDDEDDDFDFEQEEEAVRIVSAIEDAKRKFD